jgi:hypothetical protein
MPDRMMDERAGGYNGIWMNEEDQSAFELLIDNNYFYVDVQEQSHHEMNMVLEKKKHLMQKRKVALNKKTNKGNGCQFSLH